MRISHLTISLLGAALLVCPSARAADINVPSGQASISAAISAATAGDRILVDAANYTYNEVVTINKDITIEGVNGVATINPGAALGNAVNIDGASNVTLKNLTITNAIFHGIDIVAPPVNLILENCSVDGNGTGGNTGSGINIVDVGTAGDQVSITATGTSINGNTQRAMSIFCPVDIELNLTNVVMSNNTWEGVTFGDALGATTSTLNNVTITGNGGNGWADLNDFTSVTWNGGSSSSNGGAGIQVDTWGSRSYDLNNVTVDGNGGAGCHLWAGNSTYSFTDCEITNNTWEGMTRWFWGGTGLTTMTLTGCLISGNGSNGIRLDVGDGDVVFNASNITVADNGGEGPLQFLGGGANSGVIEKSVFNSGSGSLASLILNGNLNLDIVNCEIENNSNMEAAVWASTTNTGGPTVDIVHSTIVSDGSTTRGLLLRTDGDTANAPVTVTLDNSIVAGFVEGVAEDDIGAGGTGARVKAGDYSLYYNTTDFAAGAAAAHDITGSDPLFVGAGDYSLQAGSSAVDAADPASTTPEDILGITRPQGSASDIGAYERNLSASVEAWSLY